MDKKSKKGFLKLQRKGLNGAVKSVQRHLTPLDGKVQNVCKVRLQI